MHVSRSTLNRLGETHLSSQNKPLTIQRVAHGVGNMRAQIRRVYNSDEKLKKLQERLTLLEKQVDQSRILTQLYIEKIEYLTNTWPVLQGIVNTNTLAKTHGDQLSKTSKDVPIWAFHTLSNAYYELTLETARVIELTYAINDGKTELLNTEMDIAEMHSDLRNITKAYSGTSAWNAFPYEACAECLKRTSID